MKFIFLFIGLAAFVTSVPAAETDEDGGNPNVLKELDSRKAPAGKAATPPPSIPATATNLAPATGRPAKSAAKTEAPPPSVPATATNLTSSPAETPVQATRTPLKPLDLKGKIEKLDPSAGTLTVEGKNLVVPPKASVFIDNVRKSLADLKIGDLVAVTYWEKEDGTLKVSQIVKGYPRKKKKKSSRAR